MLLFPVVPLKKVSDLMFLVVYIEFGISEGSSLDDRGVGVEVPPPASSSISFLPPCCTIQYYTPYFDIDSYPLAERLLRAFMPWKLFFADGEKPDLFVLLYF